MLFESGVSLSPIQNLSAVEWFAKKVSIIFPLSWPKLTYIMIVSRILAKDDIVYVCRCAGIIIGVG